MEGRRAAHGLWLLGAPHLPAPLPTGRLSPQPWPGRSLVPGLFPPQRARAEATGVSRLSTDGCQGRAGRGCCRSPSLPGAGLPGGSAWQGLRVGILAPSSSRGCCRPFLTGNLSKATLGIWQDRRTPAGKHSTYGAQHSLQDLSPPWGTWGAGVRSPGRPSTPPPPLLEARAGRTGRSWGCLGRLRGSGRPGP